MNAPVHAHPYRVIACREYDILVPFVCHRCGNCCRKYDPVVELELLPEIARTLGVPIRVIQDRLLVTGRSRSAGRPADCCFLHPQNSECMIHDVRPDACRWFPSLTGAGADAVDCAGQKEFRSVLNAFAQRREGVRQSRSATTCGQRQVPSHARPDVRHILEAAGVSSGYRLVFETLNGMPDASPAIR